MKSTVVLCVLFVFCMSTAYSTCTHWKKRMEKYGALVNCEYYVTSESEYKDFFAFDEVAKRNENGVLKIRFFTLSSEVIKFLLSEKNSSLESSTFVGSRRRTRGLFDWSATETPKDGMVQTTTEQIYGMSEPKEINGEENYEFVFGNEVINNYGLTDTESYVTKGSKQLKSLLTPEIVRKNEPNEVLIEIFPGGKIRTTINENDAFELRGDNATLALKFISFLSPKNQVLTEIFFNCKN